MIIQYVLLHPLLLLLLVGCLNISGSFHRHGSLETMLLLGCFTLYRNKVNATIIWLLGQFKLLCQIWLLRYSVVANIKGLLLIAQVLYYCFCLQVFGQLQLLCYIQLLRYSFVAIISGLHAVMLLRYITKATAGGLLCQLLNMIVAKMLLLLLVGLLLDSCGCLARCGCLDAILMLITVGCLDFCRWFATCGC